MSGPAPTPGADALSELETIGVVLILDADLRIDHVSARSDALLASSWEQLVGQPFTTVVEPADVESLKHALLAGPETVGWRRVRVVGGGELKLHAFDPGQGRIGIDLLPLPAESSAPDAQAIERIAAWSARLLACRSVGELVQAAASVVRELTDFNGAWVSHKDPGGTSILMAADVVNAPPATGQSVDMGDALPGQPHVNGRPVPFFVADLAAEATHLSPPPSPGLELAGSLLLRPYPEFLQRMLSIGVRSLGSVPIVVGGEMWGRVIGLNPKPSRMSAATQTELGLVGVAIGARLDELLLLEEARERAQLSSQSSRVVQSIAATDDLLDGLARAGGALQAVCAAGAVVASIGERSITSGPLSPEAADQLVTVARSALQQAGDEATVASTTLNGAVAVDSEVAAGFLAIRLDPMADDLLVWARPETRRSVIWAAPKLAAEVEPHRLLAGQEARVEQTEGACEPWTAAQEQQAGELREAIGEVLIERYAKFRSLNAELTRSNEEYDAFTHAAAHDLKEPLRGIRLDAQFLLEDLAERITEPERAQLERISRLAGRMNGLLDGLMNYAQLGKDDWVPVPVNLREAVAEVVEMLGPAAEDATIRAGDFSLAADPAALRQLLLNLISNAIKYSPEPAIVELDVITLARAAEMAPLPPTLLQTPTHARVLTVSDQGIGIAPAHHERVFNLFHQLDPGAEGSGVGLALCRLLARRRDGDIWIQSEPGHGTTFFIVIDP